MSNSYNNSEEEIQSYMNQFNVSRKIAIKQINIFKKEYDLEQREAMQEVYEDIIKESH
ncbi:hypothetical protein KYB31_09275 [Clostridium felsineum]|uniref:hypothetical protein n=1 Tax=Clostridium felsineum TaxID=36839 RepID=UPI00214D7469|nr:hypothetical protein [Clostridium felsineum]MCR3759179.1 hypothetical protein [Clostridium felsineum]